jgi:hypothetical protein
MRPDSWGGAHGRERHTKAAFEHCGEECCNPPPCRFGEDNGLRKSTCPTLLAQLAPTILGGTARGDLRCRPFREMHICWAPWGRTSLEQLWVSGLWCSECSLSVCLSVYVCLSMSVCLCLVPCLCFVCVLLSSSVISSSFLSSSFLCSPSCLILPPPLILRLPFSSLHLSMVF